MDKGWDDLLARRKTTLPVFGTLLLTPEQESALGAAINKLNSEHYERAQELQSRYPQLGYAVYGEDSELQKLLDAWHKKTGQTPGQSPDAVFSAISKWMTGKGVTPVQGKGNLRCGTFNTLFGDEKKYRTFHKSYNYIFSCFDVIGLIEVTSGFVQAAEDDLENYVGLCSDENDRGQAVGALYNTARLELIASHVLPSMADPIKVMGIHGLRPALMLHLKDKVTGLEFLYIVVHLKSMRGGPAATAPVRYKQCLLLLDDLKALFSKHPDLAELPIVTTGDFNCFVNEAKDLQALYDAGFALVYPHAKVATHSMGGRLDAAFHVRFSQKLGHLLVFPFWKGIGRQFSDHALVYWVIYTCSLMPDAPECKGNTGDGDDGTSDPEVPMS